MKLLGTISPRNRAADLMKGIAVLAMVQVHITELFTRQIFCDSLAGKLSLFFGGIPAAPVFMAVMGYFLGSSSTFFSYLIRGLKLILWGFLLNIGLNFHLIIEVLAENKKADLLKYILGSDILFLAGMSVIIIGLLKYFLRDRWLLYIILAFAVALAGPYFPVFSGRGLQFLGAFIGGNYTWSYFPLFPWLAYPLTGYSYRLFQSSSVKFSDEKRFYFAFGAAVLFTAGLIVFGFKVSTDLSLYYHHGLLFFAWTLLFLFLWAWILDYTAQKTKGKLVFELIGWLGKNVTGIYAVQWLIIGNIATGIWKTQPGYWLPLWWLGILITSSGTVYLKNLIKGYISKRKEVSL